MKRTIIFGIVLSACGPLATPADAAGIISATAVITATADGPDWDYTIKLTNTSGAGNDSIATFWFAWVPGADFLATNPITVTNPSDWSDVITHFPNVPTNGFAIQYNANTAADALAPGSSLLFAFKSIDTPAEIAGMSVFYPNTPVLTSFVYSQGPLSGDGQQFLVTSASVPEPSSLLLGSVATLGSFAYGRWRRRRRAQD